MVWVHVQLRRHQEPGLLRLLQDVLFPPGVPKALYILVTPIEFVSTFFVRPFSLAVRLFANMLAGHLLLVTLRGAHRRAVGLEARRRDRLAVSFAAARRPHRLRDPGGVLQAFIFTILTAVYIGGAMHPEH